MALFPAVCFGAIMLLSSTRCDDENIGKVDTIGVLPEQFKMAKQVLHYLGAQSLFRLEQLRGINGDDVEFDKLDRLHTQVESSKFYSIVGPYHVLVSMVTDKLSVPYLSTSPWSGQDREFTYRMLPHIKDFCDMFVDILEAYDWNQIGLVYEQQLDFQMLRHFMEMPDIDFKFWKIKEDIGPEEIRDLLISMRSKGLKKFLVLAESQMIRKLFKHARRLGMISPSYAWIVPNLIADDISEGILDNILVNVTAITLLNPEVKADHPGLTETIGAAALYDAINLLVRTKRAFNSEARVPVDGDEIAIKLTKIKFEGLTGLVEFDDHHRRINYTLDLLAFRQTVFDKVGEWRSLPLERKSNLHWMKHEPHNTSGLFALKGRKAKIVTILEKPFTMYKKDWEAKNYEGNDRFEGFAIDLMTKIALNLDFQFEFYLVPDGKFGSKLENGEWNGMVGQVLAGNATMSMAPLSINAERENAIDFTKPFKTRGISVLMKTPESHPSYFQFFRPLHRNVWMCTALAVVTISLILFTLEKYSRSNADKREPSIDIKESCWFVFGSIVQGGTDVSPITVAGRILTSAWWLFALMMVSTYTANLAAFLTVKKIQPPIASVTDLAEQTKIKFGTVRNSGVETFFKNTRIQAFSNMWQIMDEFFPDSMVNNTTQGFEKVKEGNYAFLWDNTVTSYMAAMDCRVTEIGPPFDPKGFGIAVPPGATYREDLSLAILRLGDSGIISELENKWWGSTTCPDYSKPTADMTTELQLENVAGIFFILLGGVAMALLVGLVSRCYSCSQRKQPNKSPKTPAGAETLYTFPESTLNEITTCNGEKNRKRSSRFKRDRVKGIEEKF